MGYGARSVMINYYDVYYYGKLVISNVRAVSEDDAVAQVYVRDKQASASAYTGRSKENYTATRKNYE